MLFAVITQPHPAPPSTMRAKRQGFWEWAAPLLEQGTLRDIHARVGRGAVAIFDVPDNDELHRHLTAWAEQIPAEFDVYPLVERAAAREFLAQT